MKNAAVVLCLAALVTCPLTEVAAPPTPVASDPTPETGDDAEAVKSTLVTLCDTLLGAQVRGDSANRGALVCPSTNPQEHPLHSRAGEAVYPLAVVWQRTKADQYREGALLLGRWLIGVQQPSGAWGENAPAHDGWTGTTADQLISLAGAYQILRDQMPLAERSSWRAAITRAAEYIVAKFPMGPTNYWPTGAVALELATTVVPNPPATWRAKERELIAGTLRMINADGFVTGEGGDNAVDLGYNLAQTIGYLGLYGQLTQDEGLRDEAARRLRLHQLFVYPNGTIDNSWGTRSFKWTYESGTKTAPGVYFTFAVLADKDPTFAPTARLCLDHLRKVCLRGRHVTYGPHSDRHDSTNPPCLYGTFVRAQSLAMALEFAAAAPDRVTRAPALSPPWHRYFPSIKVAVVRTEHLMATVSAFGELGRFTRDLCGRGGSLTNLWIEGFGPNGMAQSSSVTRYHRQEPPHMPNEAALLPLTCRAECSIDGTYFTNLHELDGAMDVTENPDHIQVSTRGRLRSAAGEDSGVTFEVRHRFYSGHMTKEYAFTSSRAVVIRVVEPYVRDAETVFNRVTGRRVEIRTASRGWRVDLEADDPRQAWSCGAEQERYWCPFPGIECYPLSVDAPVGPGQTTSVIITLRPL